MSLSRCCRVILACSFVVNWCCWTFCQLIAVELPVVGWLLLSCLLSTVFLSCCCRLLSLSCCCRLLSVNCLCFVEVVCVCVFTLRSFSLSMPMLFSSLWLLSVSLLDYFLSILLSLISLLSFDLIVAIFSMSWLFLLFFPQCWSWIVFLMLSSMLIMDLFCRHCPQHWSRTLLVDVVLDLLALYQCCWWIPLLTVNVNLLIEFDELDLSIHVRVVFDPYRCTCCIWFLSTYVLYLTSIDVLVVFDLCRCACCAWPLSM